ncbi:MAG: sigma 54-interacting transcriptional regulator [Acidobacteriota bacterium]
MDFPPLQSIALATAQCRDLPTVLRTITDGLAQQSHVALARLWLLGPGDLCASCSMAPRCPDRTRCLHLAASSGNPSVATDDWRRTNGQFRRIPLNSEMKVGKAAISGEPILIEELAPDSPWVARPGWLKQERVVSFAGYPLIYAGQTLGVVAVFSRQRITAEAYGWLGTFASHAAVAIANARNLEEIDRLRQRLELENSYLREEVAEVFACDKIAGDSPLTRKLIQQIQLVAPTEAAVLVQGESGTGKELVARALHSKSSRAERPLIKVNCASIPRELFESEFFGHARGSFTGAVRDRVGRFQLADGGTLFLDEVGEIPIELQGKLLRVLQEGEFERVGEDRTRQVNVRIIAATNRDLRKEVDAGHFRLDLFYRLSVFPIDVPPLRDRREDIPILASHFLKRLDPKNGAPLQLRKGQMDQLVAYDWPGNVRELQNVIERGMILAKNGVLHLDLGPAPVRGAAAVVAVGEKNPLTEEEVRQIERDNLRLVLERTGWKIYGPGGAAEWLGIKPTTLASRIQTFGLVREAKRKIGGAA